MDREREGWVNHIRTAICGAAVQQGGKGRLQRAGLKATQACQCVQPDHLGQITDGNSFKAGETLTVW